MANFVVTGKLGGGKTLGCVARISEALAQGRRVATNLDLELSRLPGVGRRCRNARVLRVPDRPTVADIQAIGFGMEGVHSLEDARRLYDEEKFGLLVLDECGTWLNSRDWQEAGRRELIDFLLHIRKHLWDVYFIIQDVSMLDKQVRKALAEHVVYCRRMDRIAIPLLGTLSKLLLGKPITLPKLHVAHVKYGDQPQSLTVDKWYFKGLDLYAAYDTTQVFTENYAHGLYSVLPPWYHHHRSFVTWNWRKRMQLSRIYLRKHSKTMLLAAGVAFGAVGIQVLTPAREATAQIGVPDLEREKGTVFDQAVDGIAASSSSPVVVLHNLQIESFHDDGIVFDVRFSDGEMTYTLDALTWMGYTVVRVGPCAYRVAWQSNGRVIGCRGG